MFDEDKDDLEDIIARSKDVGGTMLQKCISVYGGIKNETSRPCRPTRKRNL